jgi:bisphosphoglycerate-dependent phosphoglycerate mutase
VSRLDPSGADQSDAEHPSRNRKVVGLMMSREQLAEAVLADVTHGVVPYLQEELVQQLGSC